MTVNMLEAASANLLDGALDEFLSVEPESLGDVFLAERARALLRASDRVAGALAATIAEAEGRGLTGTSVSRGGYTGSWLARAATARLGRPETARLIARSRTVAGLPLVAALHATGEVSTAFLDAAGAGLRRLPRDAHPSWDALLAGEARDCDPTDIAKLLAHLQVMIDPDGVNDDANAASARSELHVSPYGSRGSWAIRGTLHDLEGELFSRMLAHYAKPRDAGDTRSRSERQAAALVQILRIAERATRDPDFCPAPRGTAGHLVILARHDTWRGEPGSPAATTEATVVDPGKFAAVRCTTQAEVLLHGLAERVTGTRGYGEPSADDDAALVKDILAGLIGAPLGAQIEPLAYARGLRSASRAQWFALIARDRHCVVPDCGREPSWWKPTTRANGTPTAASPTSTTSRWSAGNITPGCTDSTCTCTHRGAGATAASATGRCLRGGSSTETRPSSKAH